MRPGDKSAPVHPLLIAFIVIQAVAVAFMLRHILHSEQGKAPRLAVEPDEVPSFMRATQRLSVPERVRRATQRIDLAGQLRRATQRLILPPEENRSARA